MRRSQAPSQVAIRSQPQQPPDIEVGSIFSKIEIFHFVTNSMCRHSLDAQVGCQNLDTYISPPGPTCETNQERAQQRRVVSNSISTLASCSDSPASSSNRLLLPAWINSPITTRGSDQVSSEQTIPCSHCRLLWRRLWTQSGCAKSWGQATST